MIFLRLLNSFILGLAVSILYLLLILQNIRMNCQVIIVLVDEGIVSPAKYQKNRGNCWSFTAMAVLESCILKLTNITYDLSENYLKNLMAYYSNWGWNSKTNDGGKVGMTLGYFSSWLEPVLDEIDRYSDGVLLEIFDAVFQVDNAVLLQRLNFTNNNVK